MGYHFHQQGVCAASTEHPSCKIMSTPCLFSDEEDIDDYYKCFHASSPGGGGPLGSGESADAAAGIAFEKAVTTFIEHQAGDQSTVARNAAEARRTVREAAKRAAGVAREVAVAGSRKLIPSDALLAEISIDELHIRSGFTIVLGSEPDSDPGDPKSAPRFRGHYICVTTKGGLSALPAYEAGASPPPSCQFKVTIWDDAGEKLLVLQDEQGRFVSWNEDATAIRLGAARDQAIEFRWMTLESNGKPTHKIALLVRKPNWEKFAPVRFHEKQGLQIPGSQPKKIDLTSWESQFLVGVLELY